MIASVLQNKVLKDKHFIVKTQMKKMLCPM